MANRTTFGFLEQKPEFITTSHSHSFITLCFFSSAATISSHARFSGFASVFTPPVYSGEMKNDLRRGGGGLRCSRSARGGKSKQQMGCVVSLTQIVPL